jgi:hypothetical protein
MAKAFVNGEYIDVPEPKKITKAPAGPRVKARSGTPTTATPQGRVSTGGKPVKTTVAKPSAKAPRGFSRGSYGLKPAAPVPASPLGALGGGMAVTGAGEMLHALTPEGYGSKAAEEQSPRDYNTYQGVLAPLGQFGAGVEKVAGDIGQVVGELSTYLPEALGGIRNADGSVPKADMQELKDEQYQGMFGQDQEGYGYLASGSEQMPTGTPALPPMEMMRGGELGSVDESPIAIKDGKVTANNRYGMPDRPDTSRRGIAARFGEITGGEVPDTMEAFMVANFLQGQLQMDDSRRVGDAKDIYEADLGALPNFMSQDRMREMMPYEQEAKTAQAGYQKALTSGVPSAIGEREARAKLLNKQAEGTLNKEEGKELQIHKQAMADSTRMATEYLKTMGISDPTPEDLSAIADVIYSKRMETFRQTKGGKTAKLSQRQEAEENWIADDVPAIPYGVTYE